MRCREKRVNQKKKENGENIFFKALANRFRLTLKLISCVKEQQNFYGQPSGLHENGLPKWIS